MSRRVHLPEEEVIDHYQQGATLTTIAATYGVAPSTIQKVLVRHGVERRPRHYALAENRGDRPRAFSDEQHQQVVALYQQGMSAETVAQRFGVAKLTVQTVLKEEGIMRPSNKERGATEMESALMQDIARRYRSGEPIRSLAREHGIAESTLRHRLKAMDS